MGEGGDRTPASLLQLSPGKHSLLGVHGSSLPWLGFKGLVLEPSHRWRQSSKELKVVALESGG